MKWGPIGMCLFLFNSESLVRVSLIVLFNYLIRFSQNVCSLSIGWKALAQTHICSLCPDAHLHTYTHVHVHIHLRCMSVHMVPMGEGVSWWILYYVNSHKSSSLSQRQVATWGPF